MKMQRKVSLDASLHSTSRRIVPTRLTSTLHSTPFRSGRRSSSNTIIPTTHLDLDQGSVPVKLVGQVQPLLQRGAGY